MESKTSRQHGNQIFYATGGAREMLKFVSKCNFPSSAIFALEITSYVTSLTKQEIKLSRKSYIYYHITFDIWHTSPFSNHCGNTIVLCTQTQHFSLKCYLDTVQQLNQSLNRIWCNKVFPISYELCMRKKTLIVSTGERNMKIKKPIQFTQTF